MSAADVSVVIPAYNAARTLRRALESVARQTVRPQEILVVDDGSRDDTAAIAESFGAPVRCVRQANAGAAAARHRGVQEAARTWMAFLDADDRWEPQRLELGIKLLANNAALNWVAGRYRELWKRDRVTLSPCPVNGIVRKEQGWVVADYYDAAPQVHWCHANTILVRRACLFEAGCFDTSLPTAEDLDLWCRLADRWLVPSCAPEAVAVQERRSRNSRASNRQSFAEDRVCLIAKPVPARMPPEAWKHTGKVAYFRAQIRRTFRHALRVGDFAQARHLAYSYPRWLGLTRLVAAQAITRLPPRVVVGLGAIIHRFRLAGRYHEYALGKYTRR